jgi:hypothetical protein
LQKLEEFFKDRELPDGERVDSIETQSYLLKEAAKRGLNVEIEPKEGV